MSNKNFKVTNPAEGYFTQPQQQEIQQEQPATIAKPPAGYKPNPAYIETKSRRVQLLFKPSVHEKAKAKAKLAGISVNQYICDLVEKAVEE